MIGIMVRKGEKKNRSKEVAIDQAGTDVCAFQFVEAEQIAFLRDASILYHACSFGFVPPLIHSSHSLTFLFLFLFFLSVCDSRTSARPAWRDRRWFVGP